MRYALVLGLLCIGQGMAWADCPPGTKTKVIGTVATANDTTGDDTGAREITQQGHDVRRINVTCGSTACVATLYDSDASDGSLRGDTDDADVKAEPGCPANQGCSQDFDPPLQFTEGVTFSDDANVGSVLLYECLP